VDLTTERLVSEVLHSADGIAAAAAAGSQQQYPHQHHHHQQQQPQQQQQWSPPSKAAGKLGGWVPGCPAGTRGAVACVRLLQTAYAHDSEALC
jgi:hypothetical protein